MGRVREMAAAVLPGRRVFALVVLVILLGVNLSVDVNRMVDRHLLAEVDAQASEYLSSTRNQAFVAFGVAKTLNGLISLLQDCEISVTPVGLGITISVGEVLDPVNDLVERASWVFLASTVSSSVQQVVYAAAKRLDLGLFVTISLLLFIGSLFVKEFFFNWRSWAVKILIIGGILRLSVPLLCLTGQFVTVAFLEEHTRELAMLEEQQQQVSNLEEGLTNITERLDNMQSAEPDCSWYQPGCMLDHFMTKMNNLKDLVIRYFDKGKEIVMHASEKVVRVITMFVIRVMLLPLAWLWLTVTALRHVIGRTEPFGFETRFYEKVAGSKRSTRKDRTPVVEI